MSDFVPDPYVPQPLPELAEFLKQAARARQFSPETRQAGARLKDLSGRLTALGEALGLEVQTQGEGLDGTRQTLAAPHARMSFRLPARPGDLALPPAELLLSHYEAPQDLGPALGRVFRLRVDGDQIELRSDPESSVGYAQPAEQGLDELGEILLRLVLHKLIGLLG